MGEDALILYLHIIMIGLYLPMYYAASNIYIFYINIISTPQHYYENSIAELFLLFFREDIVACINRFGLILE